MAIQSWNKYDPLVTISPGAALANGAGYLSAAQGADTVGGDLLADFRLSVTISTAPTAYQPIYLYLLPAVDGSTYSSGSTSAIPQDALRVGTFIPAAITTAQVLDLRAILMPVGLFKILLWNACGQTLASGYTISYRPYNLLSQ